MDPVPVTSDEYRNDGALINVLTGMGTAARDKSVATNVATSRLLSQAELEALYTHGVPRRYVDAIADEILRHRPTIKFATTEDAPTDVIPTFEAFLRDIQFPQALSEVIKLQRLYGGAVLVLLLDDGLQPEEPLDISRLRAFRGAIPLSRHHCIPEDVTLTDYNKPTHYRITTSQRLTEEQTTSYSHIRIHASRIARFDGLYLPWDTRVRNTGWGQSVLQLVWGAYKRYEGAMSGLETMASDSDLFVHKIPGLMQRIAAGNEADLRRRLEANSLSRSVYGGMVVDTEEQLEFLNRTLSNLASATDPFIKDLQAATGWPASILMGDSPGGLGKEGRFEERVWSSLVEQWQEVYCRTAVTEVFTAIFAAKEGPTRGRIPENWSIHFPSVFTQTEGEKAAERLQVAQIDAQYVNLGVLNALEVRMSRFGGTEYSSETQLNEVVTEQMAMQADQAFEQAMAPPVADAPPPEEGAEGAAQETPPEDGEVPAAEDSQQAQPPDAEAQAPAEGETPPAKKPKAKPAAKADSAYASDRIDAYAAHGLRIRVTHATPEGVRVGPLLPATGIRGDAAAPLAVLGPSRVRGGLHRADFAGGASVYLAGFPTQRQMRQALTTLFPSQSVLQLVPQLAAPRP